MALSLAVHKRPFLCTPVRFAYDPTAVHPAIYKWPFPDIPVLCAYDKVAVPLAALDKSGVFVFAAFPCKRRRPRSVGQTVGTLASPRRAYARPKVECEDVAVGSTGQCHPALGTLRPSLARLPLPFGFRLRCGFLRLPLPLCFRPRLRLSCPLFCFLRLSSGFLFLPLPFCFLPCLSSCLFFLPLLCYGLLPLCYQGIGLLAGEIPRHRLTFGPLPLPYRRPRRTPE